MALAWKAGWVQALRGSNPLSSATRRARTHGPGSAASGACHAVAWLAGPVLLADLTLTGVPVVAAGGAGAAAIVRRPGVRLTSGLQHFAAGVVIAAAALE